MHVLYFLKPTKISAWRRGSGHTNSSPIQELIAVRKGKPIFFNGIMLIISTTHKGRLHVLTQIRFPFLYVFHVCLRESKNMNSRGCRHREQFGKLWGRAKNRSKIKMYKNYYIINKSTKQK